MPERLVEAVLRDADDDDAAAVLSLNNSCVPAVGPVDLAKMRWFLDTCPYFRLVAVDERRVPRETNGDGTTPAQAQREPDEGRTHAEGPIVETLPEHSNLAGFLIAMTPDVPYGSGNFKWFLERSDDFVYVDRIAVSPWFRKRGIAARLYADVERFARSRGAARITLEVNVRPRNDASLAFHERMGFTGLDERETDYGTRVLMMEKML
ncbi:MAG TPA: GNAT family N-acetyltransferase [Longimicrobiales bacterium]